MFHVRATSLGSIIAINVAGLFSLASAAWAANDDGRDTRSRTVSMRGPDLSSPAGQAALHRRILTAATPVCGSRDIRELDAARDYDRCWEQAIAGA